MLTRLEIDGFKSFEDFAEIDLSPFTVILGVNASGKSNLFDAIQFLSRLAVLDLRSAAREMRGDVADLFRQTAPGERVDRMRLVWRSCWNLRSGTPGVRRSNCPTRACAMSWRSREKGMNGRASG